ncbi:MAG: hypothetical protein ACLP9C_05915 [Acidimicrobiales bacterium]
MSTAPAAVLALVVLALAGALPVLAFVGLRPLSVVLAPLVGAVLAALAATACLVLGGPTLVWFVVLGVLAGAGVLVVRGRRSPTARWTPTAADAAGDDGLSATPGRLDRLVPGLGALAVTAAAAVSLVALRAPSVGFDARSIWLLHGRWFAAGHNVALAALRNPVLPFAHASYPPLIGGAVAVSWLVTGNHSDELGVVVIALLNACAVMAAAWAAVEVGRRCGRAVAAHHARRGTEPGRGRLEAPAVAGILVAALLVLVAFGVAGPFATDGYADLLWAVSAAGAVAFGLVLPGRGPDLAAAAVLLAVAGLTKNEGIATAMVIVVLIVARASRSAHLARPGEIPWRPVVAGLCALCSFGVWPVLMVVLGAAGNVAVPGARQGDDWSRARLTFDAMAPHLGVLAVAVPLAVVAAFVLRQARRSVGVGHDAWAWAALAAGLVLVGGVYVTGGGNVTFWLATSVHRTTEFPALCGWWIIGTWAIVGTAQGAAPARAPAGRPIERLTAAAGSPPEAAEVVATNGGGPGPTPTGEREPALDGERTAVLHHQP